MSSYFGDDLLEEVFESSGAPIIPPTPEEDEIFTDEGIEQLQVDPTKSFEVFMGRRYDPAERTDASSIQRQPVLKLSSGTDETTKFVSGLDTVMRRRLRAGADVAAAQIIASLESPLQKLQRLTAETAELEAQLKVMQVQDAKRPGKAVPIDPSVGVWNTLMDGLSSLQRRLQASERDVAVCSELQGAHLSAAAVEADAAPLTERPVLRSVPTMETSPTGMVAELVTMDKRISRAEKVAGIATVDSDDGLVSRIAKLESRLALLNEAGLGSVKLLAQAAVDSLKTVSSSGAIKTVALPDASLRSSIAKLHRWDATAESLHLLVDRLTVLKGAHQDSLSIVGVVEQLDRAARKLDEEMQADRRVLDDLKVAMREMSSTATANFEELHKRAGRK